MVSYNSVKYQGFKKRLLHERSFLGFEFPMPKNRTLKLNIPFLENIEVSEKGRAQLNEYNLVGRAGSLFSYGGASSRRLSVRFNITLLHVLEMQTKEGIADRFTRNFASFFSENFNAKENFKLMPEGSPNSDTPYADRSGSITGAQIATAFSNIGQLFANAWNFNNSVGLNLNKEGFDYADIHRNYYRTKTGSLTLEDIQELGEGLPPEYDYAGSLKDLNKSINLVMLWIDLVRSGVMNRSNDTSYGPPILRLNHGTLFNNVPCLLEDYSIDIEEAAGYDSETLLPKRVNISLSLVESRTGNFGNYSPRRSVDGDNIAGWEALIEDGTMDPHNGQVGLL